MRNKRGLSAKQSKFINRVISGQSTSAQIEGDLKISPSTMQRWMNEENFIRQWKRANELLEIRRKTDEETVRIQAARKAQAAPDKQGDSEMISNYEPSAASEEFEKADDTEVEAPITERQRLVERLGEAA